MCHFGPAKIHISDQGREFCNELHQQIYLLTGVHHRITGHYHPQANGLCERMNGATMAALKKTVEEEAEDWYRLLDAVAYSYRATKCRAIGLSPFEVLFGRKMGLPINLINNPEEEEEDLTLEQAMELEKQLKNAQKEVSQPEVLEAAKVVQKEIFNSVSKNICKEQNIQKNYFDKWYKGSKPLEVGTKVYRRNLTHAGCKGGKMDFSFLGPYTIVAVDAEKSVYTLQDDKGKILTQKVNASNLKLAFDVSEEFPAADTSPTEPVYTSHQPKKCKMKSSQESFLSSQDSNCSEVPSSQSQEEPPLPSLDIQDFSDVEDAPDTTHTTTYKKGDRRPLGDMSHLDFPDPEMTGECLNFRNVEAEARESKLAKKATAEVLTKIRRNVSFAEGTKPPSQSGTHSFYKTPVPKAPGRPMKINRLSHKKS